MSKSIIGSLNLSENEVNFYILLQKMLIGYGLSIIYILGTVC